MASENELCKTRSLRGLGEKNGIVQYNGLA